MAGGSSDGGLQVVDLKQRRQALAVPWRRGIRATSFIGSSIEHRTRVHQLSRKTPAQ